MDAELERCTYFLNNPYSACRRSLPLAQGQAIGINSGRYVCDAMTRRQTYREEQRNAYNGMVSSMFTLDGQNGGYLPFFLSVSFRSIHRMPG